MVSTVRIISLLPCSSRQSLRRRMPTKVWKRNSMENMLWGIRFSKSCCRMSYYVNLFPYFFFFLKSKKKIHRSLMAQLSAFMEGFHPRSAPLTQYEPFHAHKKFLTKVLSAVCSFFFFHLLFRELSFQKF